MGTVFAAWAGSAAVLMGLAAWLGTKVLGRGKLGILIDSRGRFSLTQLQLVLWSILLLSLISGVFWGRLLGHQAGQALNFKIPDQLLAVLGISVGSTVTATTVKAGKETRRPASLAASDSANPPRLAQVFLLEEGEMADQVIDVTKFQNFWITLILIAAYTALVVSTISNTHNVMELTALPKFSSSMVTLLGISHAGYVAGKVPDRTGTPKRGPTVKTLLDS